MRDRELVGFAGALVKVACLGWGGEVGGIYGFPSAFLRSRVEQFRGDLNCRVPDDAVEVIGFRKR